MKTDRPPHALVASIADHAFRNGVPMRKVLAQAEIAPSTWTRLSRGAIPKLDTLDKLTTALDSIIGEKANGQTPPQDP